MYTIYADSLCFYNDQNNLDETKIISPSLELGDNVAGKFTFTMPVTNVAYDYLRPLSSEITIRRYGELVWKGRAISEKRDFWKNRQITCEGELGFLNDTIQPQHEYEGPTIISFLQAVLDYHNSKVSEDKQFQLGEVTVTGQMKDESGEEEVDPEDIIVITDFTSTFETIKTKLLDVLEGHLVVRTEDGVRYLDYLADYGDVASQVIQFGRNLMDFVINYDETEFCTAVIPLGMKFDITAESYDEYLDITDVNDGKNYLVNEETAAEFGYIEKIVHFDEIEDENELLQAGLDHLRDTQFGTMSLEVNFLDLSAIDVNAESFKMLQQVRVRSRPHGLDKLFPITGIKIPLDDPGNTSFTLGEVKTVTLSDINTSSIESIETKTQNMATSTEVNTKVNNVSETVTTEVQRLETSIQNVTTGVITMLTQGEATTGMRIQIDENKYYIWSEEGLQYTSDGGTTMVTILDTDGHISSG